MRFIPMFLLGVSPVVSQAQTVTDFEGNVYNTVTIGSQVWMKENLRSTKYNEGTNIPVVSDSLLWPAQTEGACCFLRNDEATYKELYGALYNHFAVTTDKLCPTGWHVPTQAEWTVLLDHLSANGFNYDGTTVSNKVAIAMSEFENWYPSTGMGCVGNDDYVGMHNGSGFSARPAGYRYPLVPFFLSYMYEGSQTSWWARDMLNYALGYVTQINNSSSVVLQANAMVESGNSCRCLRTSPAGVDESLDGFGMDVYPNPSSQSVTLSKGSTWNNAIVTITDLQGRTVMQLHNMSGTNLTIDISTLPSGIYGIQVMENGAVTHTKVIRQ